MYRNSIVVARALLEDSTVDFDEFIIRELAIKTMRELPIEKLKELFIFQVYSYENEISKEMTDYEKYKIGQMKERQCKEYTIIVP